MARNWTDHSKSCIHPWCIAPCTVLLLFCQLFFQHSVFPLEKSADFCLQRGLWKEGHMWVHLNVVCVSTSKTLKICFSLNKHSGKVVRLSFMSLFSLHAFSCTAMVEMFPVSFVLMSLSKAEGSASFNIVRFMFTRFKSTWWHSSVGGEFGSFEGSRN